MKGADIGNILTTEICPKSVTWTFRIASQARQNIVKVWYEILLHLTKKHGADLAPKSDVEFRAQYLGPAHI
jgi:hypothetical protein